MDRKLCPFAMQSEATSLALPQFVNEMNRDIRNHCVHREAHEYRSHNKGKIYFHASLQSRLTRSALVLGHCVWRLHAALLSSPFVMQSEATTPRKITV